MKSVSKNHLKHKTSANLNTAIRRNLHRNLLQHQSDVLAGDLCVACLASGPPVSWNQIQQPRGAPKASVFSGCELSSGKQVKQFNIYKKIKRPKMYE